MWHKCGTNVAHWKSRQASASQTRSTQQPIVARSSDQPPDACPAARSSHKRQGPSRRGQRPRCPPAPKFRHAGPGGPHVSGLCTRHAAQRDNNDQNDRPSLQQRRPIGGFGGCTGCVFGQVERAGPFGCAARPRCPCHLLCCVPSCHLLCCAPIPADCMLRPFAPRPPVTGRLRPWLCRPTKRLCPVVPSLAAPAPARRGCAAPGGGPRRAGSTAGSAAALFVPPRGIAPPAFARPTTAPACRSPSWGSDGARGPRPPRRQVDGE